MLPADLIRAVEQAGGHLEPDGDGLLIEAPMPLPEPIMIELRARKTEVIDFLARPVARVVLLHCPPGVPEAWAQGVADLLTMAPPTPYTVDRWKVLREDFYHFLSGWAARAHQLGWMDFDLFCVHHTHPWARLDCMGLVPLLQGRDVAALSEGQASIKSAEGRTLTYRRKIGPRADGACLLWELSQ